MKKIYACFFFLLIGISSLHSTFSVYPNNWKNWEFDKEASQIFSPGRATVFINTARDQGRKFEAKPTQSKTNSSSYLGIPIPFYQILFSSEDSLEERLVSHIDKESKSICCAVYALSHPKIVHALINAQKRGVRVQVLIDPFSLRARFSLDKMFQSGISLFVWQPAIESKVKKKGKKKIPLMHEKFCVFGSEKVWTGSFNFTVNAAHLNRENAVVLESAQVADQYLKEFERLKKQGAISYKEYLERHPGKERPLASKKVHRMK